MDCNPQYAFGHAIVAGQLASKEIKTLEQYKQACSNQGISCYPGAWEQWSVDTGLNDEITGHTAHLEASKVLNQA